jgi:hypothetical protein
VWPFGCNPSFWAVPKPGSTLRWTSGISSMTSEVYRKLWIQKNLFRHHCLSQCQAMTSD